MKYSKCDCCGITKEDHLYGGLKFLSFSYLCHLDKENRNKCGYVSICNGKPVSTSGRFIEQDLCLECYNKIMIEAVKKFEELKEENK